MAVDIFDIDYSKVAEISKIKKEPKWMSEFRLKAFEKFTEMSNPHFGPELKIDFSTINYYKRVDENVYKKLWVIPPH